VVGFKCTVAGRVTVGVVKEKQQARRDYKEAVDRGETAGLLEQYSNAADCFTTRIGNVPPGEEVIVEIIYLGELKNDAETDGVRFTIPTVIAPRYGSVSEDSAGLPEISTSVTDKYGIRILVDIAVEEGVAIRGVQSPTHPIAMTMGRTSSMPEEVFDNQYASATLTLGKTHLEKDFIIVVASKGHDTPRALLEHHPTIPNHRALMATLVPKFGLPQEHPEIVFVADRSGSMGGKISILVSALKIFLKSLPVGVKFNICSFGSHYDFLWPKSKIYDQSSLSAALAHVGSFDANYGGTEMLAAVKETVKNRYKDMHLEIVIVTDGEIWNQNELFNFINQATTKKVRFFSLGIGAGASSGLVEGVARSGDGFAQFVGENEKMEKRVVRMLKGALTPHVKDYTMEVKYGKVDNEYEMVESVTESLKVFDTGYESPGLEMEKVLDNGSESSGSKMKKKIISLFDESARVDDKIDSNAGKYDHLPHIDTPKLLQAPHKIPSLYSFNRTSVYLLMSSSSCQHTPKAIVLRASSEYGPLELEIPVQDVGVGETVHQLAARKAVHELEEGRGWITESKDRDCKLVKTKFEGRFDEMVEREAVRLGVQFQVGGKWCSFVAVEKNSEISKEGLPEYEMIDKEKSEESTGEGEVSSSLFLNSCSALKATCFGHSTVNKPSFGSPNGLFGSGTTPLLANGYGRPVVDACRVGQPLVGGSGSDSGTHSLGASPSEIQRSSQSPFPESSNTTFSAASSSQAASSFASKAGQPNPGPLGSRDVEQNPFLTGLNAQGPGGFGSAATGGKLFGAEVAANARTSLSTNEGGMQQPLPDLRRGFERTILDSAKGFNLVSNATTAPITSRNLNSPSQFHSPPVTLTQDQTYANENLSTAFMIGTSLAAQQQQQQFVQQQQQSRQPQGHQMQGLQQQFAQQQCQTNSFLFSAPALGAPVAAEKKKRSQASWGLGAKRSKQSLPSLTAAASPSAIPHTLGSVQSAQLLAPPPGMAVLNGNIAPFSASQFGGGAPIPAPPARTESCFMAPRGSISGGDTGQVDNGGDGSNDDCRRVRMRDISDYVPYKKSASRTKAASPPLPRTDEERMHELISLQAFDGSWGSTARLFVVLGVQDDKVKEVLGSMEETVMATLVAVAFLEGKMAAEEGVWEMIVEKAKGWLEGKIGAEKVVDGLAKAGGMFGSD
jgi:von Willebrand factor type A domain/Vault protein inter-alpha-trypsin domain